MRFHSKLEVHDLLGDRYLVQRKIGEGGMSHVYLVEDMKLRGKQWAVKETVLTHPNETAGALAEAEMLISLNHPHLPQIVDFFAPDREGYVYLIMDFIEGETLAQYYDRHGYKLPLELIMSLALQLCDVLHYLHGRQPPIVYRDLKPANVMIDGNGQIRLIDFGIARHFKQSQLDDTHCLGTVGFAAPEQYAGRQSDTRSDLYGLGALLLYLLTGGRTTIWDESTIKLLQQDIPAKFMELLQYLLQLTPDHRVQTADQVKLYLFTIQENIQSKTDEKSHRLQTRQRGTRIIAILGVTEGVGATHTAIAFAHYAARLKCRVAIVECSDNAEAFSRIETAYEGEKSGTSRGKFTINGVDYCYCPNKADIVSFLHQGYDDVILDLGNQGSLELAWLEEFRRADVQIVVGSGAEWRQEDIIELVQGYAPHERENWTYLVPLAESQSIQDIRKSLQSSHVYALPYHPDPFVSEPETDKQLNKILGNVAAKPKSFFSRLLINQRSKTNVEN